MRVGTKQELIPELRFSEFTESWNRKSLKNLTSNPSYGMNAAATKFDGNNKYLRITDIDEESRKFSPNPLSSPEGFIDEKFVLKEGDIVFARTGASVGKSYLYNKDDGRLLYAGFLIKFSITGADSNFIFQQTLRDPYNKWVQIYSMRSGQPGLNAQEYKELKLNIPKIEEQQKIASFFTTIDKKITLLSDKIEEFELYKKGLVQKLFSQEIRFKDENDNKFPKWEKKKLGELTFKVGKKNKENVSYPIYSINNQEGFLPQSEQFDGLDSNDRGYDISLYKIVNEKTFAYNPARINVGSIGYSYDLSSVIVSSLYVCFKTKEDLEDCFLLTYLDTDRFNKDILRYQEGGVRQYLFFENFSQIPISLPCSEEQIKIANFLEIIEQKINKTKAKLEEARNWKKGLLQKMFV